MDIGALHQDLKKGKGAMDKKRIIIDCDPGTDDAVALLLAFQADNLDVQAITTVAGNTVVEKTSVNALKIAELAGREIKVAKGAGRAIMTPFVDTGGEDFHGADGLGNVGLPEPKSRLYEKNAAETIYEVASSSPNKIYIVAVGPLTNVALALLCYPELKEKIERIVIMGGVWLGGNASPVAEANILHDPEAAHIVFTSGIPVTMCGLDVTHKALVYDEDIERIRALGNPAAEAAAAMMEFHAASHRESFGIEGDPTHDACAVAYLIEPDIFITKDCNVEVDVTWGPSRGQTVVDFYNVLGKPANVEVVYDLDRERFVNLLYSALARY